MSISSREALASLNILACVAMADGKIHANERTALTVALESVVHLEDASQIDIQSVDDLLRNAQGERLLEYASLVSSPPPVNWHTTPPLPWQMWMGIVLPASRKFWRSYRKPLAFPNAKPRLCFPSSTICGRLSTVKPQ